jgi:hypothetical protein
MVPYTVIANHHRLAIDTLGRAHTQLFDLAAGLLAVAAGSARQALGHRGEANVEVAAGIPQRAFGESLHLLSTAYAAWVHLAVEGWQATQRNAAIALSDFERHVPGGTEPAVEVALRVAEAAERTAEDVAESTIVIAEAADRQVHASVYGEPARKPAKRPAQARAHAGKANR